MSASPSCSPPRRPLHERSTSQHNRLHIRVVPYSPPRLSSDGVAPSRVISYADASTETIPEPLGKYSSPLAQSSPRNSLYQDAPSPTLSSTSITKPRPAAARLRRPPNFIRPSSITDSLGSDGLYTPRDLSEEPSSPSRPSSRRKIINVHSNKTFSVHPQSRPASLRIEERSYRSRPSDTTGSSYDRVSSAAFTDDRPSSPLTPLTERSLRSYSPASFETPGSSSSPWNYRMIGGLRKVRKTPDLRRDQSQTPSPAPPNLPLPPLPVLPALSGITPPNLDSGPVSQSLVAKPSFQSAISSQTESTLSDITNWKACGQSSPVNVAELDSLPASSIRSNYELLGEPSSTDPSVHIHTRPQTNESDANFVVHHGAAASSSSSLVAVRRRVRSEYSRESMVVPPLRPTKRSSSENFHLPRSRSRDSIRTGSLSSLSNALTQEATRALFVGPPVLLSHGGMSWQDSFAGFSSSSQSRSGKAPANPYRWSSQLSTVMSESEGGSISTSRPLSPADRRSSGFHSNHSRLVLSMTPSLGGLDELTTTQSHSRHGSVERPPAVHIRTGSRDHTAGNIRLIRDQDEDGDGLADLEELRHRSSQRHLARFLSSYASDRSLRSNASSRANSFNGRIPAWAKVYYGSGERRWLAAQASSDSMHSQYSEGRTASSFITSRSPSQDRSAPNIYVPRRRPQERGSQLGRHGSNTGSMDIRPVSPHPVFNVVRNIKKQTSSIWSPHLGRDRRAARFSMWEPPAADWSAKSELTGKRNIQIVLFVVGFVFPLAWMMAACVPLPGSSDLEGSEHDRSTSNLDLRQKPSNHAPSVNETVYDSARWWRNVNRIMSIVGLLVLGAIIALIVLGVRQRW